MPVYIRPYKNGSKSVKVLRDARPSLKIPRRTGRGNIRGAIINWGDSTPIEPRLNNVAEVLNQPMFVEIWSDKRKACEYINSLDEGQQSLFIEQTMEQRVAQQWADNGGTVVVRTLARASCGRGIIVAEPNTTVPHGQLYSKYQKKKHEYRVHVGVLYEGNARVLCAQRKAKKRGVEYTDTRIRNAHSGNDVGWVFLSTPVDELPLAVTQTAIEAVQASGLDFAGADIIYNERFDRAWVVELNTAPGIGATDAQAYLEYFDEILEGY